MVGLSSGNFTIALLRPLAAEIALPIFQVAEVLLYNSDGNCDAAAVCHSGVCFDTMNAVGSSISYAAFSSYSSKTAKVSAKTYWL
jgi:hypothetical protein